MYRTVLHGFWCSERVVRRILRFRNDFCSTGLLGVDWILMKNSAIFLVLGPNAVAQYVFQILLEGSSPHRILRFVKYIWGFVFNEMSNVSHFFGGCKVEMGKCFRK